MLWIDNENEYKELIRIAHLHARFMFTCQFVGKCQDFTVC